MRTGSFEYSSIYGCHTLVNDIFTRLSTVSHFDFQIFAQIDRVLSLRVMNGCVKYDTGIGVFYVKYKPFWCAALSPKTFLRGYNEILPSTVYNNSTWDSRRKLAIFHP